MNTILMLVIFLFAVIGLIKMLEVFLLVFQVIDPNLKNNDNSHFLNFITSKKYTPYFIIAILIICFAIAPIVVHNIKFVSFLDSFESKLKPNEIGDAFGGTLSPFIGLLGAGLTYLAFYMQYKANEEQKGRINEINFENNFYQLLSNHHTVINSLNYHFTKRIYVSEMGVAKTIIEPDGQKEGTACITKFVDNLITNINDSLAIGDLTDTDLINIYNTTYNDHHSVLSHYIRNLFHFFVFVDNPQTIFVNDVIKKFEDEKIDNIPITVGKKKYDYSKIIRAQLSSSELIVLAFNCQTDQGKAFDPLVRKYRLLKNINLESLPVRVKAFISDKFPHVRNENN